MESFQNETELISKFREDGAYLSWVMALYLDRNDVVELATDSLTDGKDDKKIDFIDLDIGNSKITIAQGYYACKMKDEAPANKAADMNTALAWMYSGELEKIPEYLREIIKNCREAIDNDEISVIELVYVHNLPESDNCRKELNTIQQHHSKVFETKKIDIQVKELGRESIENMYTSKESQIIVKDMLTIEGEPLFTESAAGWDAYVFSITGKWLYDMYKLYGEDLFSANYRGFLGVGKRKKINNAIKQTAESEANNFWVFNNGITILTLEVDSSKKSETVITGMSIINGAQTTGSLSSIEDGKIGNLENVKVLCRIIKCNNPSLIPLIVKANNTQNEIASWDTYSNDAEQRVLKEKFAEYGKEYSLKRGFDEIKDCLGIYSVAQPTLAFEGNYQEASRGKNNIFLKNSLYTSVFRKKTARHLLLIYTLSKAVANLKYDIKQNSLNDTVLEDDKVKVSLFRNLKFKMFFVSMIADCLQAIVSFNVDKSKIAFSDTFAKEELESQINIWYFFVDSVLTMLIAKLGDEDINDYIDDKNKYNELASDVCTLLKISYKSNPVEYNKLKDVLWAG